MSMNFPAVTEIIRKGLSVFRTTQSETDMSPPNAKGAGPKKRETCVPPQSPTKIGKASSSTKKGESANSHVPKTQSSWELIRRGLSIWKTTQSKTNMTEPKTKPKRKGPCSPKSKQSRFDETKAAKSNPSIGCNPQIGSAGYSSTNEKIHCILQDTRNFNDRIKLFSGTSKEDKEYLDIEEVLFYNLTELVHINTDNLKLKKQKLDAIFMVQEIIKKLDLKLEENVEKAIKRIGYISDIFVAEGRNKTKPAQRIGNITNINSAKNNRNRPHFQVTKQSLPLVDEINKVKTSLKSCGQNRAPSRKVKIIENCLQIKDSEEKETPEASMKSVEQKGSIQLRASEQVTHIPLENDVPKTESTLQPLEKNKPSRQTEIVKNLALVNISEESEPVEENSLKVVDEKQPVEVAATENPIQLPMDTQGIEIQPEQTETCLEVKHQKEELSIQPLVLTSSTTIEPEKNEKEISTTNNELCANLDQNRRFSLVRALVKPFLMRRNKLRVTNLFRIIQHCVQEAQNQFDFSKNNPYGNKGKSKQNQNLVNDHKQSTVTTLEAIPLRQKGIKNDGDCKTESMQGGIKERRKENEENVMQGAESRKISVLLLQIRFLLFLTVMKLLQIPYEIAAALSIVLWLWES